MCEVKKMNDHEETLIEELMKRFARSVVDEKPRAPVFNCFYREHHPKYDAYEMAVISAPTKEIARLKLIEELSNRIAKKGLEVYYKDDSSSVIGLFPSKTSVAIRFDHFHFIRDF